jgi:hypothetical protein
MPANWILTSIAGLAFGSLLAWRLWSLRQHPETSRLFFLLSFGLAVWVVTALCLFRGQRLFHLLVATLALYLPSVVVAVSSMMKRRH